jgi:hypothetical protein
MNNNKETNNIGKKTTYSVPVYIAGGIVVFFTIVVAIYGLIKTSQVSEADSATIANAKKEAAALVPVENRETKETIETALLDSTQNVPASDLNLRNTFDETVGPDRPANSAQTPVTSQKPIIPATVPSMKLQPGKKTTTLVADNRQLAVKMPEKQAPLLPSFESRYRVWENQIAEAQRNKQPEPNVGMIYATAEVEPTGYLQGGERKLVNFTVLQADQELSNSFSLEQGERLFDAVVSEINETGVIYRFDDGKQKFTPYISSRDIKPQLNPTTLEQPAINSPNKISKIHLISELL